ncbi:hypothetical protein ABEB36_006368 [Hypothenemus hampei]|uniref:Serine/threonine-protein kinase 11-interacting protein n=1 Tax=Hypothenemus hampei TaxID=57062 RepID=A0ABD1EQB0_HYPHA
MCDPNLISTTANLLRPVSRDVLRGKDKLCLSTVYLQKFNKAFDDNASEELTTSFHLTEARASLQVDLQFLLDLVKSSVTLKLTADLKEDNPTDLVNIRRFHNLKTLEIIRVNPLRIVGIQKLRSRIENLICKYNLEDIETILVQCGGDCSHSFNWNELKYLNFSRNRLKTIGNCFESTPYLQVLDISHNELSNIIAIEHLPHLKELNLSYNKLTRLPKFSGQICKRLRVLLANNNFIEDIGGLATIANLHQLDLSQNCLMDHSILVAICQMSSLYSLDLRGNPLTYHPVHRTLTCNYFNRNTSSLNVVLDNVPLTKTEKSLAGSLHPILQNSLGNSMDGASNNSLDASLLERQRRVRNVVIFEGHEDKNDGNSSSVSPTKRNLDKSHLDVKKKIEQLRHERKEQWLSHESGAIFQEVLNFPSFEQNSINNDETFETAIENESDIDTRPNETSTPKLETPDSDDDDFVEGNLFVGGSEPNAVDLCIVITDKHLSERNGVTTKETARWGLDVVKNFRMDEETQEITIDFDVIRSDRISRKYYFQEPEKFLRRLEEGRNQLVESTKSIE